MRRTLLIDRLNDESETNLIWVSGRAGAGKTSIVSSWFDQHQRHSHDWVRLNPDDEDPTSLLPRIAAAMLPDLSMESNVVAAARRYLYELTEKLPDYSELVLDDHERLAVDSDIQRLLVALAEKWPSSGTLVFVGRLEPPPAFVRLRALRDFVAISDTDLLLSDEEVCVVARLPFPAESSYKQIHPIVTAPPQQHKVDPLYSGRIC